MRIDTATIALITGASSGIGAATARLLARKGAQVLLLARSGAALEEVAAAIRAQGGAAHVYPVDLTDAAAVEQTARRIMAEVGVPDLIISNAGSGRWLTVEETSPEEVVALMAMPYFAAFYLTRAFLPALRQRGSGHLVYVNSPAARLPWPGSTAYAAARWALRGFVEALRMDLHRTKLRVTTVIPGTTSTGYFRNNPGTAERIPGIARLLPVVTADHVAQVMVRGVEAGKREVMTPWMLRIFHVFYTLFPRPFAWLVALTGWRSRRPRRPA